MSQHLFSTQFDGKPVVVMMGWDRPLQGFFLVVEASDDKNEEYVYTNLEDPALIPWMGLPPTIEPFLAKLRELGIEVPARMVEEVKADAMANTGNRYVTYDESGAMTN